MSLMHFVILDITWWNSLFYDLDLHDKDSVSIRQRAFHKQPTAKQQPDPNTLLKHFFQQGSGTGAEDKMHKALSFWLQRLHIFCKLILTPIVYFLDPRLSESVLFSKGFEHTYIDSIFRCSK